MKYNKYQKEINYYWYFTIFILGINIMDCEIRNGIFICNKKHSIILRRGNLRMINCDFIDIDIIGKPTWYNLKIMWKISRFVFNLIKENYQKDK